MKRKKRFEEDISTLTEKIYEEQEKKVTKSPKILKPLESQTALVGDSIMFEAEVEAYPTCTFQWFHNSIPVKASIHTEVCQNRNKTTIILKSVKLKDSGKYICRAKNIAGYVMTNADLSILPNIDWERTTDYSVPKFVTFLNPVLVEEGQSALMMCEVKGKPLPRVDWFHSGRPITQDQNVSITQDTKGVCKLVIKKVKTDNTGLYTCKATNRAGEALSYSSIEVKRKDMFDVFNNNTLLPSFPQRRVPSSVTGKIAQRFVLSFSYF